MFDAKTAQLNGLRDALKRDGVMYSDVGRLMEEYILDVDLRRLFGMDGKEEFFPKAVWYCICNNNADRDMLILRLHDYFLQHARISQVEDLIKYALFLGGVDYRLNDLSKEMNVLAGKDTGSRRLVKKSFNLRDLLFVVSLVIAAIMIGWFIIQKHSDRGSDITGTSKKTQISKVDLVRNFEGFIEENNTVKEYRMSISYEDDEFKVYMVNIYLPSDNHKYNGSLKKSTLTLKESDSSVKIELEVKKAADGRSTLNYERHKVKWSFISQ